MEFALDEHHGPFAYTNEEASAIVFLTHTPSFEQCHAAR
jgi:hypothetical protein